MTQVLSKLARQQPSNGLKFNKFSIMSSAVVISYWTYLVFIRNKSESKDKKKNLVIVVNESSQKVKNPKPDVKKMFKQLKVILTTILTFKDVLLTAGISVTLLLRILLDLYQINNGTQIEKAIITLDTRALINTILSFAINMPIFSFANNFIRFTSERLALSLRQSLSLNLYREYMTDIAFYKLAQQNSEIQNVDQLLTSDIDKFCYSLVEVYNNLTRPMLNIFILFYKLSSVYTGYQTPIIMISYLAFAGAILSQSRKSMAYHVLNETQSEGQLRYVHSRIIQNSEEICFYKGNKKELDNLEHAFETLYQALDDLILFRFKVGFANHILGRYSATIVGYLALALPFFSFKYSNESSETKLGYYYVSGRMMMKLAESIERVIVASNDLSKLAAYTQRVQTLLDNVEKYKQLTCNKTQPQGSRTDESSVTFCDDIEPMICFNNATISTPQGEILLRDVSLTIKQHQNVIITGPNGSGKSSIFRVLAGLWTVESGKVIRPRAEQLFYICQKPYMTLGTFRDQIIYPDTQEDFVHKGLDDEHLIQILDIVSLKYLLDRHNKFDTIDDWQDVLSGGEKQRIALARLIYHKPQFAILDESTSAVSIDAEQSIYKHLSENLSITLLSVTHRIELLRKFHQFILKLDRDGSYVFKKLTPEDSNY